MPQPVLLIFIKNPIPGQVKTRLAATVGHDKAMLIYKELLRHTREVATALDVQRLLYYSHYIDENDEWDGRQFEKKIQAGQDLGERMGNAFEEGFHYGSPVLIIGSDCAELQTTHLQSALQVLEKDDFVIGPAHDGGYYLLGMKAYFPQVFNNIVWSTDTVLEDTIRHIGHLGKTCAFLPTLTDIDHEEDWLQFGWPVEG